MIVADTSYVVEGLLHNAGLFSKETLVVPDLTLYETANILWKHQQLIQDLKDASEHLEILEKLVSEGTLVLVRPDGELTRKAYNLSIKHKTPFYDTVFVALALQLKLDLKSFDKAQIRILTEAQQPR